MSKSLDSFTGVNSSNLFVKASVLEATESQNRKSLPALNAADILIGSIRKLNDMEPLSEENKLVRDAMCKSLLFPMLAPFSLPQLRLQLLGVGKHMLKKWALWLVFRR